MASKSRSAPPRPTGKKGGRRPPPPPVKRGRPWGMIAIVAVLVVFAVGVIGYAVYAVNQSKKPPQQRIAGLITEKYAAAQHTTSATTKVQYDRTPPMGGKHWQEWADCTGTVYPSPIQNEFAVHSLEHGAVWITYLPSLPKSEVDQLAKLVQGQNYTMMSPYPNQGSPISIQSWGEQLKVTSPSDPRLAEFIKDFRNSQKYTPEFGASCSNPQFRASPKPPLP